MKTEQSFPLSAPVRALLFLLLLALAGCGGMRHSSAPPADTLNTDTDRLTDNGHFRVRWQSDTPPVAINRMHTWTLTVESADGTSIDNAAVAVVGGGMPDHGHGLPTRPEVTTNLGGGNYRVEGVRFQMGGWWEITFQIDANGITDSVTFNLVLGG
jgi:hypothetical protein